MGWQQVTFTREEIFQDRLSILIKQVSEALVAAGSPPEAFMFDYHNTCYFSPMAAEIASHILARHRITESGFLPKTAVLLVGSSSSAAELLATLPD